MQRVIGLCGVSEKNMRLGQFMAKHWHFTPLVMFSDVSQVMTNNLAFTNVCSQKDANAIKSMGGRLFRVVHHPSEWIAKDELSLENEVSVSMLFYYILLKIAHISEIQRSQLANTFCYEFESMNKLVCRPVTSQKRTSEAVDESTKKRFTPSSP